VKFCIYSSIMLSLWLALPMAGQQPQPAATNSVVPRVVNFSGTLSDVNNKPLTGVVGVTFSLYRDSQGGTPLWMETQNVQLSKSGHYSVTLGSTTSTGLSEGVFVNGEARWLGVQVQGQDEQPRVLLVAVPYALKSGDAETLGGLPVSAFLLAPPAGSAAGTATPSASSASSSIAPPAATITGRGTAGFLPDFTGASTIGNSAVFQSGVSPTAKVGINTNTPASALDVAGTGTIRGTLALPATGAATAASGKNSQPQNWVASAFNSGTSKAVNQTFQWQAEPAANDTSSPSGTLNLLFGSGTTKPTETGLHIASNGQITFATGQTFPGTGNGTVTSVASGGGLTGGPIKTSGTLSIASGGVTNAMLLNPSLTISAGSGLTGGGSVALGGSTSLSINTAVVPQLNTPNTFTQSMLINTSSPFGSLQATGTAQAIVGTMTTNDFLTPAILGNASATGAGATIGVEGSSSTTSGYGVYGVSGSSGTGVYGSSTSGYGVYATSTNGYGLYAISTNGTGVSANSTSTGGDGIEASGGFDGGYFSGSGSGSYSENSTDGNFSTGAYGFELGSTKETIGVHGYSASTIGIGTFGQAFSHSTEGTFLAGLLPIGVWGDSGYSSGFGVFGSTDDGVALAGLSNSPSGNPTAYFENDEDINGTAYVLVTYGGNIKGTCTIDVSGNLACTGSITKVVPAGSRNVAMNTISSPEHWFEDAGSGQLSNGEAVVNIEPVFGETVNTGVDYHVFLTPKGDCKGLYVAQESPTSFAVRELGGGTSTIAFDYRIMAKRKGFEQIRLVDRTDEMNAPRPKRAVGPRPAMPSAQEIRKAQEAHLHTAHVARPILKTK
jgi:hypothetical protein